jgi:prophage maintenance system killer protein
MGKVGRAGANDVLVSFLQPNNTSLKASEKSAVKKIREQIRQGKTKISRGHNAQVCK